MIGEAAQEISFYVSGGKIAAKVWGPENGWPILAVHGWLDNAGTFDAVAPYLSAGYKIVALELSGHGQSFRKAPGTGYHFADWLLEVHEVVAQLGWKQFSFLGHSLGGQIGTIYAGMHPGRVRDLILLDTVGPVTMDTDNGAERFAQHISGRISAAAKPARTYPDVDAVIELMVRVMGITRHAAGILLRRGAVHTPEGVTFSYDRRARVNYPAVFTMIQTVSLLSRVSCPVLILKATRGYAYDPGYFELQASALRYKHMVNVEGNHHFHLDVPELTAKLTREFLQRNSRLAPAVLSPDYAVL